MFRGRISTGRLFHSRGPAAVKTDNAVAKR